MSNNIFDTNVDKIRTEVRSMIDNIGLSTNADVVYLSGKYPHLHETSKTLFNHIIKESQKQNFDKTTLFNKLEPMLKQISKIQKNELTQNDASENIGILLAKEYIPQYK